MSDVDLLYHLKKAQEIALTEYGIGNILQPGIIKEFIMSNILQHNPITQKDTSDASDEHGLYEYLCSIRRIGNKTNNGCSFQLDRITRSNLHRITRNKSFYFGIFINHLEIDQIWKIETSLVQDEVLRQLENSKNSISHVNFLLNWVKSNGAIVYDSN